MPPGIGYGKKKRNQEASRKAGVTYTGGAQAAASRKRKEVDEHFAKIAQQRRQSKAPSSPPKAPPSAMSRLWGALTGSKIKSAISGATSKRAKEEKKRKKRGLEY